MIKFPTSKSMSKIQYNKPTHLKHFQIKTRISSITTIQLKFNINNPKLNIKINNNLKALKFKKNREEKGEECSANARLNCRCTPDSESLQSSPLTCFSSNLIYNPNLDSGSWRVERDGMMEMRLRSTLL